MNPIPPLLLWLGATTAYAKLIVMPDYTTGSNAVVGFQLFRALDPIDGPWTLVDSNARSLVAQQTNLFDESPLNGTMVYYSAKSIDALNNYSDLSEAWPISVPTAS